jgi:hypothetical protein
MNQDARAGAATLAVVEIDAEVHPGKSIVEIRIREDDVRRLAAELEGDLLEIATGRRLEDLTTNPCRSGEGNLINIHMGSEGGAGDRSAAREDIDHPRWEASLTNEAGDVQGRERSLLGGLDNNRVPGRHGRPNLPHPHHQWEIPGNDLGADADGLMAGVHQIVRVNIDRLAKDLIRPTGIVAQAVGRKANITAGHRQCLPVVQGFDGGEDFDITLDQLGQLGKETAALCRGDATPGAVESAASRGDSTINVLLSCFLDLYDGFLVVRVNSLDCSTIGSGDKLVIDEPETISSVHNMDSPGQGIAYRPRGCSYLQTGVSIVVTSAIFLYLGGTIEYEYTSRKEESIERQT